MKPLTFRSWFENHPVFVKKGPLFLQNNFHPDAFEDEYVSMRQDEGRLLDQMNVTEEGRHLAKEWNIRIRSSEKLVRYLRQRKTQNVLEIGCGNGWLIRKIHEELNVECCGIDKNQTEIKHAAERSHRHNLTFAVGDITSEMFPENGIDVILLAAAIQYFENLSGLIDFLRTLLLPSGEIHIVDSPFYDDDEISAAKQRSNEYFRKIQHPAMAEYYFHHRWSSLAGDSLLLYDPRKWTNRIFRRISHDSPFPWIRILKIPEQQSTRSG